MANFNAFLFHFCLYHLRLHISVILDMLGYQCDFRYLPQLALVSLATKGAGSGKYRYTKKIQLLKLPIANELEF